MIFGGVFLKEGKKKGGLYGCKYDVCMYMEKDAEKFSGQHTYQNEIIFGKEGLLAQVEN